MTDDPQTRYRRSGFNGSVRRGRRPVVVVVDCTRGFTDPDAAIGSDMSAELDVIAGLIREARQAGAPVLFTAIAFPENVPNVWLDKAPGLAMLREGSPAAEIDPRLPREPSDPVIVKTGASAFFGTDLATVLRAYGADTVLVCGATTSGCVRATAVDAVQYGFPTLVISDAVADRLPSAHHASLIDIQAKYADVVDAAEATNYLREVAAVHQ
ncbi:carbamoylsarcosine amidase [Mycolicibacterium agri]|uniref:Carbamoylsarcosine amidase n=1 Tax=Mycolicibacterium agri TaxID=36811 RepID=A0A2A7MNR0_MYCAG|nr:carbamoylsarcosine amidase [Mycolicibacterium agri]GFG51092.1 isochorismatase [Mycolicibacterium agri]